MEPNDKLKQLLRKWEGYDKNLKSAERPMMQVEMGPNHVMMTAPPPGWRHESEPRDDMDYPKGAGQESASMRQRAAQEAMDDLMVKHGVDIPPRSEQAKAALERFNRMPAQEQMDRHGEFKDIKRVYDEGQKAPRSYPPRHPAVLDALRKFLTLPEEEQQARLEEWDSLSDLYYNGSRKEK
jgi:hypothetical protein